LQKFCDPGTAIEHFSGKGAKSMINIYVIKKNENRNF